MFIKQKIILVLSILLILFIRNTEAQNLLRNGEMEGPELGDNYPPYFWGWCSIESDPQLMYIHEAYDGTLDPVISPDGSVFILMRTRGVTYISSHHSLTSLEDLYTELISPLKVDYCYRFEAYLAFMRSTHISDEVEPNVAYPLRLELWGGTDSCNRDERLIESELIDNEQFERYIYKFAVKENEYPYIYIRPFWDTINVRPERYNGIMFLENLKITEVGPNNPPVEDRVYSNRKNIYFKVDEDIYLTASKGTNYSWEPATSVSDSEIQSPVLLNYEEQITVKVTDENGCTFFELFNVIPDCDSMYPGESFYTMDTTIKEGKVLKLQPFYGNPSKLWEPDFGLNCVDCPSPFASPSVTTLYSIELTDEFDCVHEELFYIEVEMEIPNVITPNDDGYNDLFIIKGIPPQSSLSVFDKNGYLIYKNDSYGYGEWWDGRDKNNKKVEAGNYWYILDLPEKGAVKKGYIFVKQ